MKEKGIKGRELFASWRSCFLKKTNLFNPFVLNFYYSNVHLIFSILDILVSKSIPMTEVVLIIFMNHLYTGFIPVLFIVSPHDLTVCMKIRLCIDMMDTRGKKISRKMDDWKRGVTICIMLCDICLECLCICMSLYKLTEALFLMRIQYDPAATSSMYM